MRRKIVLATAAMLGVLMLGVSVFAASVHFKGGLPIFTDNGITLTARGALAGLGNQDLQVKLTATGIPAAIASATGKPKPSSSDGWTRSVADASSCSSSPCGTTPGSSTFAPS